MTDSQLHSAVEGARPLAIVLPEIGVRSETFIRRHVCDLLPDGCVAVTDPPPNSVVEEQGGEDWLCPGPVIEGNPGLGSPGDPPPTQDQIARVADQLRQAGTTVVLAEYLDFALRWLPLHTNYGFRFVVHGHGVDVTRQLREPAMRRCYLKYSGVDRVVVPTAAAKADLVSIGLAEGRISVVPYGTDVSRQPQRERPGATVRCVAVGRMVAKKAPMTTLRAFAAAQRVCSSLRLDCVGDGPLRDDAEALLAELGVGAVVQFHGALPHHETLRHIRSADILVHAAEVDSSGDAEGLPLVILEAMAAGIPVVATDHKGIPEAVLDGSTGLLAGEGDVDRLAESLVRLASSAILRARFGEAGWQRARDCYSWERNRLTLLGLLGLEDPGRNRRTPVPEAG